MSGSASYKVAYDRMIEYISEASVLSIGQVRDVYAVMHNIGLIDYDIEKEVVWEFSDEESEEDE